MVKIPVKFVSVHRLHHRLLPNSALHVFLGYEGVPEFFTDLLNHITSVLQGQSSSGHPPPPLASPTSAAITAPVSEERSGTPAQQCCSLLGEESHNSSSAWILEGDDGLKSPCQRLGCNSAVSPNFQQHCVATIATKASSQWPPSFSLLNNSRSE